MKIQAGLRASIGMMTFQACSSPCTGLDKPVFTGLKCVEYCLPAVKTPNFCYILSKSALVGYSIAGRVDPAKSTMWKMWKIYLRSQHANVVSEEGEWPQNKAEKKSKNECSFFTISDADALYRGRTWGVEGSGAKTPLAFWVMHGRTPLQYVAYILTYHVDPPRRGPDVHTQTPSRIYELKYCLKWGSEQIHKYRYPDIPRL